MAEITCVVVTPERTALEQRAEFVALTLYDGEVGVGENHTPFIGRLGYGELRLKSGGATLRYYIDGGFVQVADNVVSVLTQKAVPAAEIDAEAARRQLDEAKRQPVATPEQLAARDRLVSQARAQLRMARG